MNYTLSEIARICGGTFTGENRRVTEVVTDSRSCGMPAAPLFVAMCGARHDSHDFVDGMYARGVRAFLVERPLDERDGAGYVVVGNAIDALQRLAADWRRRFGGTVVGITGSNGKTVVKEWIAQTAPDGVKLFRSPRSYNSQLGAALSLLMIEGDERFALIEAGISQPGEMARLERMISPDVVLFTSLGDAHQEHFASVEEKCAEKLLLALHAPKIIYHSAYEPLASMLREVYAAGHELHDAAAEAGGGLADAASERNSQLVAAFWRVAGEPGARFRAVAARGDAARSERGDQRLAAGRRRLQFRHQLTGHRAGLSARRGGGTAHDADPVRHPAKRYGRRRTLCARGGDGRGGGRGAIRRHRPEVAGAGGAFVCDKAFYASTDDYLRRIDRADIAGRAVLLKGNRDSRFEKLEHALSRKSHTTVLEVDLDAMTHNLNYFRSQLRPGVRLVAMVKAASYGAGDFEVAQLLQHQGVDYLAVAFADEGVLLRERGITMPVVVLNADADSFDAMAANRLEPEIYSLRSLHEFAAAVERYGEQRYPIHVKLDTGMHRLGFVEEELPALLDALARYGRTVRVASVFAHLCTSDDPAQDDFTRLQIARFDRMSSRIAEALPYPVLRHTANSAAIERFPEAQYDMCRLGLGLYGFGFEHNAALCPVSTLRTRIVQIKRLAPTETVGYGRAGVLSRPTVTATVRSAIRTDWIAIWVAVPGRCV